MIPVSTFLTDSVYFSRKKREYSVYLLQRMFDLHDQWKKWQKQAEHKMPTVAYGVFLVQQSRETVVHHNLLGGDVHRGWERRTHATYSNHTRPHHITFHVYVYHAGTISAQAPSIDQSHSADMRALPALTIISSNTDKIGLLSGWGHKLSCYSQLIVP